MTSFTIRTAHEIKRNDMVEACTTYRWEEMCIQVYGGEP